jgi:putative CocE/NonD family hydrolase
VERAAYFASRGYVFVAMDVRGRGDSDGHFVPYRNDGRDGYDAIEWCASQPWSNGKVGTLGNSYAGRIQWLAAKEHPPHLAAMIVQVTPSDPFVESPTGVPSPMDISWHHFTAGRAAQNMDVFDWAKIHWHLPLATMDEAAGRKSERWRELFEHTQLDAYWEPLRYQNQFHRIKLPVMHVSGWYDDEQVGTPLNFIGMVKAGAKNQRLLMGPWPHAVNSVTKLGDVEFGPTAKIDLEAAWLRFFDRWLKGIDNQLEREPPIRLFVMGDNRWRDESEWPLARTHWTKVFLHSAGRANSLFGDGVLTERAPRQEKPDSYTSDPEHPVPFITDASFSQIGGPDDYRAVERRDDVLVYSGEPLAQDTEVCGPIKATLWASASARDADFMAKLIDVWPDGFAQRLTDGMVRARFANGMDRPKLIEPGKIHKYTIDLWNTCQVFKRGHRIRLEVASSAFPKYDRNPQTGEALGKYVRLVRARIAVFHDAAHPSQLVLPIIPRK